MSWPVLVEEWQFECCGEPFAVGDLVQWQLSLVTDLDRPDDASITVDGVARGTDPGGIGPAGAFLDIGTATVLLRPPRPAGPATVTGVFAEDHHGLVPEALPAVTGRIIRVREISAEFQERDRVRWPVSGTWQLTDLRGFADRSQSSITARRATVDLLVDLAVDV
ncbi:DUF6578 domain-containing protein [Jiangella asiatica]|uniref:Uncharacterized protein n=1 Tax=Jiangella asiatica TaxID=2530372 RepID=A0A4R5DDT1_9ACTN|nr:hypothetical protein E1269_12430 [Jiangella asiatica]